MKLIIYSLKINQMTVYYYIYIYYNTNGSSHLKYLMNRHEQVERKVQELQRELMDLRKRIDFLLPVGDRMPNFALEELGKT